MEKSADLKSTLYSFWDRALQILIRSFENEAVTSRRENVFPNSVSQEPKSNLLVHPGPEGRLPNVSPARKGWGSNGLMMIPSAVGAAHTGFSPHDPVIRSLIFYSVRSALIGSTLAARLAGTALAANATKATPNKANR